MWFNILLLLEPKEQLKPDERLWVEWFLEEMEQS